MVGSTWNAADHKEVEVLVFTRKGIPSILAIRVYDAIVEIMPVVKYFSFNIDKKIPYPSDD